MVYKQVFSTAYCFKVHVVNKDKNIQRLRSKKYDYGKL